MSSSKSDKSSAEQGIQQAGAGITAASQMTGPESTQYQDSFDIGKLLKQIEEYQMGIGQKPTGYQDPTQQYLQQTGPLGQSLYGQVLKGAQDPYANYESSLQPALKLAENYINQGANQRGLLTSGIPIGQMGTAGVNLAIQEAQGRMQAYQQALSNAQSMGGNIQATGQQNLQNLSGLYGTQQALGQQAMGRQAQGATQAAQYSAYPYQAQLGSIYGQQAGNQAGMYGLGAAGLGAAGTLGASAIGAGATTALANALPFAMMCWVASEIFGGWNEPKTCMARYYISNIAPKWFKNFYLKHGENIAKFIHNKPIFKWMLRPLFEYFVLKTKREVELGII